MQIAPSPVATVGPSPGPGSTAAAGPSAAPTWFAELTTLRFSDGLVRHGLPEQGGRAQASLYEAFGWELDGLLADAAWAGDEPESVASAGILQMASDGKLTAPAEAWVFAVCDEPKEFYLCLPGASQCTSRYAAVMVNGYDDQDIAQIHATEWMPWDAFNPVYLDYIAR